MENAVRGYDIIGNIALIKFDRDVKAREKKKLSLEFLEEHKNVKTVLEKAEKFSGRLRTQKGKWLAGEKTKEVLYRENNCVFRLNVDSCYFSPRLSSERKELAGMTGKKENVLVMFAGVAPLPIVIGKSGKASKIVSVELGRDCNKYAVENVRRNKLIDKIEVVQGDVRKVIGKGKKVSGDAQEFKILGATKPRTVPTHRTQKGFVGFDRIVMARPNLKDSFLDVAFEVIKSKGVIHYYGFYDDKDKWMLRDLIMKEAEKAGKKIRIIRIKKAGEIGAYKHRFRVDFRVY